VCCVQVLVLEGQVEEGLEREGQLRLDGAEELIEASLHLASVQVCVCLEGGGEGGQSRHPCMQRICMLACLLACEHTYIYTYVHACMHAYKYVCMHACIQTKGGGSAGSISPLYPCVCAYVCTQTHNHTQPHTPI